MSQIRKTYFFPHFIGRNTQKTVSSVYKKPPRAGKREEDNQTIIFMFCELRLTRDYSTARTRRTEYP